MYEPRTPQGLPTMHCPHLSPNPLCVVSVPPPTRMTRHLARSRVRGRRVPYWYASPCAHKSPGSLEGIDVRYDHGNSTCTHHKSVAADVGVHTTVLLRVRTSPGCLEHSLVDCDGARCMMELGAHPSRHSRMTVSVYALIFDGRDRTSLPNLPSL